MNDRENQFPKALLMGVAGAFFFAFNFILIRMMNLGGGYFLWMATLRYFFTLPMMAILVWKEKGMSQILANIKAKPFAWIVWSTVGFGLFYAPLLAASIYGESWFTAAIWQFTIVAGVLLTPLFGSKIPLKNLCCSFLIVAGILLMQYSKIKGGVQANWFMLFLMMGIAAFSYPLGNRKTMQLIDGKGISTIQRIFGMTLCSMPFWCVCAVISGCKAGAPSASQVLQAFLVALLAGVVATILFFRATDLVKHDQKQLAVIEATQSGEVVFTLLLGILLLHDAAPDAMGFAGVIIIILGMVINSMMV